MRPLRLPASCLAFVLVASFAPAALAQTWPDRPITLVNPSSAGGGNELIKTVVFDRVAIALGKPIVMESRGGANGAIAAGIVARAAPDGHTLMLGLSGTLTSNPSTQLGIAYDPLRDFTPISTLIDLPLFLVVTKAVPAENLRELVDAMRRKPGRYNYGSWGPGSVNFLTFEQFKLITGTQAVHVPYKGGAPLLQAILSGDVQVALMDLPTLRPHLDAGTIRTLGIAAATRYPTLPDLPTLAEQGIPITAGGYLILVAPAGLPDAIANRLNAEVVRVLAEPDVRRRLLEAGNVAVGGTREEAANRIATDIAKWKRVVRDIGYQAQ
jgi:tripartite-type tricarboxylate transporter receptor subunit TctC